MTFAEPLAGLRHAILISFLCLAACGGGGDSSSDGPKVLVDPNAPVDATAAELSLSVSGETRHSADETYSLDISLTGSLASSATLSIDEGPNFLNLDNDAKTISATYSVAGVHTVVIGAKSGNKITSTSFELTIDTSLNGRYRGVTEDGNNTYTALVTRDRQIFWDISANDGVTADVFCRGSFETTANEASGNGHCKRLVDGIVTLMGVSIDLTLTEDELSIDAKYSDSAGASLYDESAKTMSRLDGSYLSEDIDISGVYFSTQLAGVKPIHIDADGLMSEAFIDNVERFRCAVDASIRSFDFSKVTISYDGSIRHIQGTWENCDLSDQSGLRISIGNATGIAAGAVRFYDVGVNRYIDTYLSREIPTYTDPVSKLNYVRVCFAGEATSIAPDYNVTNKMCENF